MFTAALFTTAKTQRQQVSINRRMDKEFDIHTHAQNTECYSTTKKWNNTMCSNMDGPRDYHTKRSKSNRERQKSYDTTLKMTQMNLFTK